MVQKPRSKAVKAPGSRGIHRKPRKSVEATATTRKSLELLQARVDGMDERIAAIVSSFRKRFQDLESSISLLNEFVKTPQHNMSTEFWDEMKHVKSQLNILDQDTKARLNLIEPVVELLKLPLEFAEADEIKKESADRSKRGSGSLRSAAGQLPDAATPDARWVPGGYGSKSR